MSRAHTERPVWTWVCNRCGATSGDLAYQQSLLPSPAAMRERGWFIADVWGDLCPRCNAGDHPGGVITCDAPGCTRTRRNYCTPTEREQWVAFQQGNKIHDLCPDHKGDQSSNPAWLTEGRRS